MTIGPSTTSTTTTTTTRMVPLIQQAYLLEKDNETGVKHQGPRFKGDIRVPTADGLKLGELISQVIARRNRLEKGWIEAPLINVNPPRQLTLSPGKVILPCYPGIYSMKAAWAFEVPALAAGGGMLKREDYVYVVSMVAHVGADIDPSLVVTFSFRLAESEELKIDQKENELRFRVFTGIVVSPIKLTPEVFYQALAQTQNIVVQHVDSLGSGSNVFYERNTLTIANKTAQGFALNNGLQFYALDENWKQGAVYAVEPKLIDLVSVCCVKRIQNVTENGITLGKNGEEPLTRDFNIIPALERYESLSPEAVLQRRLLLELFAGNPGKGGSYERAVVNLAAGPIGSNLDKGFPGIPASTPNGSVSLATGQRLSVSNQAFRQDLMGALITAGNDGAGNAELVYTLGSNVPTGTKFSTSSTAHRVFALNGTEISALGLFRNLGGSGGPLVWTAGQNARSFVTPGQGAFFVPAIEFPAGSGANLPFKQVTRIWLNAREIDKRNIRIAYIDDPDSYCLPDNGEQYIVTVGPERGALPHYILAHLILKTNAQGVLMVPNGMGCFAFVQGVTLPNGSARVDLPIIKGLTPNADYKCLVYKPPLPSEAWQFELLYPAYEGIGNQEPSWLDGATVISLPCAFAHTQGSGTSVFKGEGGLCYSPIATYLPIGSDEIQYFQLDAPIQWVGEGNVGDITFRSMPIIPGAKLSLPIPGQKLTWQPTSNTIPPRSMQGTLSVGSNPVGFRTPKLSNAASYQAVFAFLVQKNGVKRMFVLTQNTTGDEDVSASSDAGVGMDLFFI